MAQLLLNTIQRVKTYQIFKWHYQNPNIFNPYKLAAKGYQCVELNTLQCHICHNKVAFSSPEGQSKAQSEIISQLSNHQINCCYKNQQFSQYSSAQLYLRMDQLIQATKESYKDEIGKSLPMLNMQRIKTELRQHQKLEIIQTLMTKYKMDLKSEVRVNFFLILMGWMKKNQHLLECAFCGRVVQINEYKNTNNGLQRFEESIDQNLFDPFDEHRYFCFWVYDQNGWEIYIQHLYDKLGQAEELFKKENPYHVQKIRTLIDVYLGKFKNIMGQNFEKAGKILTKCSQMAKQLQENEEQNNKISEQVGKRKKQMEQFLLEIDTEVRLPLKRIKID